MVRVIPRKIRYIKTLLHYSRTTPCCLVSAHCQSTWHLAPTLVQNLQSFSFTQGVCMHALRSVQYETKKMVPALPYTNLGRVNKACTSRWLYVNSTVWQHSLLGSFTFLALHLLSFLHFSPFILNEWAGLYVVQTCVPQTICDCCSSNASERLRETGEEWAAGDVTNGLSCFFYLGTSQLIHTLAWPTLTPSA